MVVFSMVMWNDVHRRLMILIVSDGVGCIMHLLVFNKFYVSD